jgi:hypothetical protein
MKKKEKNKMLALIIAVGAIITSTLLYFLLR